MAHNDEMNLAWQFLANTNMSVFLTGKAGTGKTTFLRRIRDLSPKRMVVLAPTGVAAINAGGQTIHSFFQLSFGPYIPGGASNDSKRDYKMAQQKKNLIRTLDLLVIDEVSMVRADLLDQVDDALRKHRDRTRPFGGVQLLLIGDLMQLSPVAKSEEWSMLSAHYDTPYFFSSHALKQLEYVTIELRHIYRQQDESFINLLAKVRDGYITEEVKDQLNARYIPDFKPQGDDWIRLTTHNAPAQQYNDLRMAQLSGETRTFEAVIKGEFPELSYPADQRLELKEGAQVMFIKNDPSLAHAYFNGKIGILKAFTDDGIEVVCDNGRETIKVTPVTWDNTKYTIDQLTKMIKEDIVGTFTQYPLRLAWAITVHKSQGLTFEHAVLDIRDSFAHGQAYVALSRCRTLEGMVLSSPLFVGSVITDRSVNQYIDSAVNAAADVIVRLPDLKYQYTLSLLDELYSFVTISQDLAWFTRVVDEYLSRQQPQLLQKLKGAEAPVQSMLTNVALRFAVQYKSLMQQSGANLNDPVLSQRIKESSVYFSGKLHELFDSLLSDAVINIENKSVAEIYSNALDALRHSVRSKTEIFESLTENPFTTHDYLNLKAKAMLGAGDRSARNRPKKADKKDKPHKQPKEPKAPKPKRGSTLDETYQLYKSGLSVTEIANKRSLVESTIYSHLAALAEQGRVDVNDFVSPEHQKVITDVLRGFTSAYTLSEVRERIPEDITYGEIKITVSTYKKSQPDTP